MNDFMPEDYKVPSTSRYMRWQAGENRFRVLGSFTDATAIMGMEYWKSTPDGGRKPVRVTMGVPVPIVELEENDKGELDMPKHFWALPVYNYQEGMVQILELTQKTIMNAIKDLSKNKKWGNPKDYDIVVTKTGERLETKYTVVPDPKEELSDAVKEAQKTTKINIVALFSGEDPFKVNEETVDPDEIQLEEEQLGETASGVPTGASYSGKEKLRKATPGK